MNDNWTEIKITVPAQSAGTAGDIANMTVPHACVPGAGAGQGGSELE